jgi:hypothetical protein
VMSFSSFPATSADGGEEEDVEDASGGGDRGAVGGTWRIDLRESVARKEWDEEVGTPDL